MNYPGRLVRRGELNKNIVKAVQRRLNELNAGPLLIDGEFGVNTEKSVRLFQLNFTNEDGLPLHVDGVIGPATWACLFDNISVLPPPIEISPFVKKVLQLASHELGVREQPLGSNRGQKVDEYIRTAGLNPSAGSFAWCVMFLYWCFHKAAEQEGRSNPMYQTASVHELWNKSRNQPYIKRITPQQANNNYQLIQPGQIFCMDFGSGRGHVGLVKAINNGRLITIEGNTNVGGSREGIGVFERQTRQIEDVDLGFIDYTKA